MTTTNLTATTEHSRPMKKMLSEEKMAARLERQAAKAGLSIEVFSALSEVERKERVRAGARLRKAEKFAGLGGMMSASAFLALDKEAQVKLAREQRGALKAARLAERLATKEAKATAKAEARAARAAKRAASSGEAPPPATSPSSTEAGSFHWSSSEWREAHLERKRLASLARGSAPPPKDELAPSPVVPVEEGVVVLSDRQLSRDKKRAEKLAAKAERAAQKAARKAQREGLKGTQTRGSPCDDDDDDDDDDEPCNQAGSSESCGHASPADAVAANRDGAATKALRAQVKAEARAAREAAKAERTQSRLQKKAQREAVKEADRTQVLPPPGTPLIVDIYNITPCDSGLRSLLRNSRAKAASAMVSKVEAFLTRSEGAYTNVAVVLDYGTRDTQGTPSPSGLTTVYHSGKDNIADDLIVDLVAASAASGQSPMPLVVTSDRELRGRVAALGATSMGSGTFHRHMKAVLGDGDDGAASDGESSTDAGASSASSSPSASASASAAK